MYGLVKPTSINATEYEMIRDFLNDVIMAPYIIALFM